VCGFTERIRDGDEKALEQRCAVVEYHTRLDMIARHPRGIDWMMPRGEKELRPKCEVYVGRFLAS
jgi:hypothetical protein